MKFFALIVWLAWIVLASPTSAHQQPKILYEEDATLLTSDINVVILTGSLDDAPEKTGTAHLLAEWMLRGTKKKSREKIQMEIERLGGGLGVNVFHDRIVFSGSVIRENTLPFLRLIEECLTQPALSPKELETLKREVLAQIYNIKNNNGRLGGLVLRREIFKATALERPVQGTISTVNAITHDDLIKAYNNRFHRGNFIFAVASALTESEISKHLTAMWLKFPDGLKVSRRSLPLQIPDSLQLIVVHKPQTSTGSVFLAQQGITAPDPARFALAVGDGAFGANGMMARLFRIVRSELGWTYAIGSTYGAMGSLSHQQGLYLISLTPSIEFTVKSLFKTLALWKEYLTRGLNSDEYKISQESLINAHPFQFDSAQKRVAEKLYSHLYDVPILTQEQFSNTLQSISLDKLNRTLNKKQKPLTWAISVVADKAVIEDQLAEEQKGIPIEKRLKIFKVYTPEDVIR